MPDILSTKDIIKSQYYASLEMLKQAIIDCPASLWDNQADTNRFWHIAYHTLFYTHLYLHPSEEAFTAWEKYREDYHFMGPRPMPPYAAPEIEAPYRKDELLEYLDFCWQQVDQLVTSLDLEGESGFHWLPFGKLELQFYNIRHLQHHTGELSERLGTRAKIDINWVGMRYAPTA